MFAEVAADYWFANEKAFVGTGIGVWDLFDGDNVSPTWLLNFGRQIHETNAGKLFFVGEGRLFLNKMDSIDNNYQFWGGVRFVFR